MRTSGRSLRELLIEGHLYPNFKIAGAVTGRFTCSNPNLQNIPRDGFKNLLLPPPGKVFVGGDLSQIELRIAGQICGEEVINQVFREGRDLIVLWPPHITGKPESVISKSRAADGKGRELRPALTAQEDASESAAGAYGMVMDLAKAREVRRSSMDLSIANRVAARNRLRNQRARLQREPPRTPDTPLRPGRLHSCDELPHPIVSVGSAGAGDLASRPEYARGRDDLSSRPRRALLAAPPDRADAAAQLLEQAFLHGFATVFPEAPTNGLVEITRGNTWAELKTS